MQPTTKRKRSSSETYSCGSSSVAHSSAIWFDDGNIILQAENISFRVHKSVLALHSTIIRDMLLVAGPLEHDEGCPVVVMEGDFAQEWEELLLLIYHGYRFVNEWSFSKII